MHGFQLLKMSFTIAITIWHIENLPLKKKKTIDHVLPAKEIIKVYLGFIFILDITNLR